MAVLRCGFSCSFSFIAFAFALPLFMFYSFSRSLCAFRGGWLRIFRVEGEGGGVDLRFCLSGLSIVATGPIRSLPDFICALD